ncbi:flagellar basal body-associated FliL family protein [Rhizobiaceae bacterium n13]|uniref:Flagellar protein FliL n=1 Tax=Ferirhizobium litorale TaxID=2927786 RepID=A0AAE3U3F3_9HYPH|nr:flagellar basal body-associated FliL family protein [Fererhizobium litorale]MDI7863405.1 flagellar basal body-associated FliL family protein [Fererhizobium litorale]MDI7922318.1 flagellar basal body-associated FliL family protein [Fererhizobium litorale]
MATTEGGEAAAKKTGPMAMIASLAVLTLLGGGGGWYLGNMIAEKVKPAEVAAAQSKAGGEGASTGKRDEDIPRISTEESGVVQLDPITVNLAYPSENWVRVEVALLFNGPPDLTLAEAIHEDILGYMRTVSLQQIQGPRGFQFLKDDVQERVDLRSQGRVTKVLFRTFVVE